MHLLYSPFIILVVAIFVAFISVRITNKLITAANVRVLFDNIIWFITFIIAGTLIVSALGWSQAANLTAIIILVITLLVQGMLQSVIYGAYIILEGTIRVGDYITVSGSAGTVKNISLRTVKIVNDDGRVIFIPTTTLWLAIVERGRPPEKGDAEINTK